MTIAKAAGYCASVLIGVLVAIFAASVSARTVSLRTLEGRWTTNGACSAGVSGRWSVAGDRIKFSWPGTTQSVERVTGDLPDASTLLFRELVVTVYSYTASGLPIWYLAFGPVTNNTFTSTLDKFQNGQCISCAYRLPVINGNDGTISITFTSSTSAMMTLPGGRNFQIVPQDF
jgi:hypothetical protein